MGADNSTPFDADDDNTYPSDYDQSEEERLGFLGGKDKCPDSSEEGGDADVGGTSSECASCILQAAIEKSIASAVEECWLDNDDGGDKTEWLIRMPEVASRYLAAYIQKRDLLPTIILQAFERLSNRQQKMFRDIIPADMAALLKKQPSLSESPEQSSDEPDDEPDAPKSEKKTAQDASEICTTPLYASDLARPPDSPDVDDDTAYESCESEQGPVFAEYEASVHYPPGYDSASSGGSSSSSGSPSQTLDEFEIEDLTHTDNEEEEEEEEEEVDGGIDDTDGTMDGDCSVNQIVIQKNQEYDMGPTSKQYSAPPYGGRVAAMLVFDRDRFFGMVHERLFGKTATYLEWAGRWEKDVTDAGIEACPPILALNDLSVPLGWCVQWERAERPQFLLSIYVEGTKNLSARFLEHVHCYVGQCMDGMPVDFDFPESDTTTPIVNHDPAPLSVQPPHPRSFRTLWRSISRESKTLDFGLSMPGHLADQCQMGVVDITANIVDNIGAKLQQEAVLHCSKHAAPGEPEPTIVLLPQFLRAL